MIKYFSQKLDMIYASRRALNKEFTQKRNSEILAAHPQFADMMRDKKKLELELAKNTALKIPADEVQSQLDAVSAKIREYATINKLNFSPKHSCAICKDSGYIGGKVCNCLLEEYRRLLKENMSVSPVPDFTFADNTALVSDKPYAKGMDRLFNIIEDKLCSNFDKCKWSNFMVSGASGIGKTSLALATANSLIEHNISVLYLTSFELVNIFLDKHTHKQTAMSKLYDYVLQCEMLIVDNLGSEPIYKNVTMEYLYSTIERRLADGKKTMICTQLGGQAIINRYGETFLTKFADKRYSLSVMC